MTKFSSYLQAHMDRRDWNQSDLARAAGITTKSVSEYMNQGVIPRAGGLSKLAKALGVNESEVRSAAGAAPKTGYFKLSQERQEDADTLDREQARIVNELIRKFADDNRKVVRGDENSSASNKRAAGSAATETYSDEPFDPSNLDLAASHPGKDDPGDEQIEEHGP